MITNIKSKYYINNIRYCNNASVINICIATNDKYVNYAKLCIYSLIMSANRSTYINLYIIIPSDLSNSNIKILKSFKTNNVNIIFKTINNSFHIYKSQSIYDDSIFLRFYIPQIFSHLDKMLYIDADTIITQDLYDLYSLDINEYDFAAVPELGIMSYLLYQTDSQIFDRLPYLNVQFKNQTYFNSGVLLYNLNRLRSTNFLKLCINTYNANKEFHFPDQDVLNLLYSKTTKYIDFKYNCTFLPLVRTDRKPTHTISLVNQIYNTNYNTINQLLLDAKILHFAFDKKLASTFNMYKKIYELYYNLES